MSKTLYTSKGNPVGIGREIGKGGEGSVFEIPALTNQVAKLYHKAPDSKKQAKLSFMSSTADAALLKYVAWPQDTLHHVPGGPVLGFLMPKVSGRDPVHMVYSPAHRRQGYPKAAWDFLLHVARNIASSFETVHGHGHIIGDVNQNSFMVGRDSTVVLIDSDSFQVNAKGTLHLCEVGVPHFTPPELQSLSSFNGFTRTTNHDNFGLALLLFHVLFGGRHPYSGVPLRSGVGDALENDIKNFRYAYARDNQARGFSPPPRSIPISALPAPLESMFHQAFTEKGATGARPSAQQWVASLDALRTHLRKCSASSMHVYPDHLSACPWCALERQGVVYFVDLGATYTPTPSGFVLTRAWALIEAVPAPPQYNIPQPAGISVTPKRLPDDIPGDGTVVFYRIIVVAIAIAVLATVPALALFTLIGGLFGWAMAGNAGSAAREVERENRRKSRETARQNYESLVATANRDAGPDGFQARKAQLVKWKDEYERLPAEEKKEIDKLQLTAHQRQMQSFLEKFFIDSANISGIGPTRKAALTSFGIETAADVNRNRVMQVRGFGEALTSTLLDWRASCERRFQFNPAAAASPLDKNAIQIKFAVKRATLESSLSAGSVELQKFCQSAMAQQTMLKPLLEAAAREVAQAEADFQLV
jgi:DNA-binding helix-hairpin-helix protein with protein kinase domain